MATYSSILAWRIPRQRMGLRMDSPWCCKESDTTEQLRLSLFLFQNGFRQLCVCFTNRNILEPFHKVCGYVRCFIFLQNLILWIVYVSASSEVLYALELANDCLRLWTHWETSVIRLYFQVLRNSLWKISSFFPKGY